ncbi:phosphoribulokinase [Sedimentitalea arenosa]|uniref:Phosphoribulokinase n=1 Tax=Sedimentitalea arenosa TaxID=2798803 RepID=A0A8J7ISL5_9RHOB|nr:phosphoribulokinase [Arenibacterium arenosum]MBJ6370647.1 phosphoribulokinase [Arenibacterium arenosum]
MTEITATDLVELIKTRAAGQDRYVVAIAGPPGSGKSTLAADLAARLGPTAATLPMDGFHLDNDRLRQLGLLHRKGAPETFDAQGFVDLLREVRTTPRVSYPTFDRDADRTVPGAGHIGQDTRIVLVEGNYLLLTSPPWSSLDALFDLTVRLDVSREELEDRLVTRWLSHGLPAAEARARALGNDMKNAEHMFENARSPDFTLRAEC